MDTQRNGRGQSARPGGRAQATTGRAATGKAESARLTRRELLVAAAAGAALAGCGPSTATRALRQIPAPTFLGRPATLYADGTVPPALAQAVSARIATQGGIPHGGIPSAKLVSTLANDTDLVLTFGALPKGYVGAGVGASALTVLTNLRVPLDGVTPDQARGLLTGAISDWGGAGSPYGLPVHVFALEGLPTPKGLTLASGAKAVANSGALLAALRAQPGSIALAPVELADWTVRNLGVGGVYPAQGRGDAAHNPWAPLTLRLGVRQELAKSNFLGAEQIGLGLDAALAAATPTFDMVVSGDIILGRGVNAKMVAYNDYLYPYRNVRDEFMSADWRVANVECTISDLVPVPTDPFTFTFVTAKKAVDGLVYAGIQTVTVANNHAGNGGMDGFVDMLNTFKQHNISYFGGGNNLAEARRAAIQTVKGVRVALLGYNDIPPGGAYAGHNSPGIAPIDTDTLPDDIAAARKQADLVIPYFHWGIEYTKDPIKAQQAAARAAIDAGADMVLGVHPHWVQAIEEYKGKLIIYALGNFVFDQDWSRPTLEGFLLHLYWRGSTLVSARWVPTLDQDRCQPRAMTPAEAVGVFQRMWSGTDMLANGEYGLA